MGRVGGVRRSFYKALGVVRARTELLGPVLVIKIRMEPPGLGLVTRTRAEPPGPRSGVFPVKTGTYL